MGERGRIQGFIDRAVEHGRNHRGQATSEVLLASGAVAGMGARPEIAVGAVIVGALIGVGSGISQHATLLSEGMTRSEAKSVPSQELVLADFTEKGSPTS